eukprot:g5190.t1
MSDFSSDDDYEYESDVSVEDQDAAADGSDMDEDGAGSRGDAVRVIKLNDLLKEQELVVHDVSSVLSMPPLAVGVLLRAFRWNREKLYEQFYADRDEVLRKCGVQFFAASQSAAADGGGGGGGDQDATAVSAAAAGGGPEELHCEICFEDVSMSNSFCLGCKHRFCRECWEGYLTNAVSEGTRSVFAPCPSQGCKEVVTEDVFLNILRGDAPSLQKYRKYLLDAFVDINKAMRWCPSPFCTNAVCAPSHTRSVRCLCGTKFCFGCGEPAHEPVTCELLMQWIDKCQNESETANWILSHTKKCPKCHTRIEKNQGCNHMTCRAAGCGHEFCWICMGPWAEHGTDTGGYYKCNRFNEGADGAGSDGGSAADKAKRELDKYLHYFKRYQGHAQAEKFAATQREHVDARMADMQDRAGTSWVDAQFLKSANEQLIECRRVLRYSYVFGYYMEPGGEKNLFEHLQEMLEKHTEQLSEHCEKPTERAQVINFTRVTERFLAQLLRGIEEGLTAPRDGDGGTGGSVAGTEGREVELVAG